MQKSKGMTLFEDDKKSGRKGVFLLFENKKVLSKRRKAHRLNGPKQVSRKRTQRIK